LSSLLSLYSFKATNGNCECTITEVDGIAEQNSSNRIHSQISCVQEETGQAYFFGNQFPKEIFSKRGIVLGMESCPTDGIIDSMEGIVATQMRNRRRRLYTREGTRRVLVVRVTSKDSYSPKFTSRKLSQVIFDDESSMRSGFSACSGGKLNILPAEGVNITNGVIEISILHDVKDVAWKTVQNFVTSELYNRYISIANYDNVIMVLPSEVDFDGAAAFAYIGRQIGVYKDTNIEYQLVTVHEFGHNLGFHHSGTIESPYGDNSCLMGGEGVTWRKDTRMCFNAAKSWYSNWYSDRHLTVEPKTLGLAWNGRLAGIDDFLNGLVTEDNQQVLMRVVGKNEIDLFLLFNRAKGVNEDVASNINELTIVSQRDEHSPSIFLAGLKSNETFRKSNWDDSGHDLVVQDCGHRREETDYAKVRIYLTNTSEDTSCSKGINFEGSMQLIASSCEENEFDRFFVKVSDAGNIFSRNCKWLKKKNRSRLEQLCRVRGTALGGYDYAHKVCCKTCSTFTA